MTALDPQAAVQFVEQQFNQADYKPTFVNQDAINRQIEACKGNPAELAQCAQAIMLGQVYNPGSAMTSTATHSTKNKSFYLAGIIAGLLLLGSAGSFLYDAYQAEQPQVTDIIVAESLQHPSETMHDDTVSTDTGSDISSAQMLASDWDEELPTEIGQTITLTAPTLAESDLQTQKQRVVIDDDAVNKMLAKQSSANANPVIDSKTDFQAVESTSNTVTGKAWVMAQPAKNYTFQIAGLSRKTQLKQYLSENELPENIWTYQTQRNNKPWYVVLYGSFSSVEQANAAKQKLPARVQKDKPWLKRFIQIQRDL